MFLQKESSYQSGDYVGEDEEGELYKGIACFMIVGLKQSVPHVMQAIPEVTITGEWLAEKISASLHSLATNAPDHPVYMMCIRVAYAHACVRACVCGLVCICMYTGIVDFTC